MVNFSHLNSIPERYKYRQFYRHNPQVTLMRTIPEENRQMGIWIAEKLNQCEGKVKFIIPEGDFPALDIKNRQLIKSPHHVNSLDFCQQVIDEYQQMMA